MLKRPPGGTQPTPFGPWWWYCGRHIPDNKKFFLSGGTHESPDTQFCHVSAVQGPQEAYGLHLLVPGAGAVGGTSPQIKNYLSGDTNGPPGAPFCPVSAPQGPQEALGLHLLVPDAGVLIWIKF